MVANDFTLVVCVLSLVLLAVASLVQHRYIPAEHACIRTLFTGDYVVQGSRCPPGLY
jgi:hypothetical protein